MLTGGPTVASGGFTFALLLVFPLQGCSSTTSPILIGRALAWSQTRMDFHVEFSQYQEYWVIGWRRNWTRNFHHIGGAVPIVTGIQCGSPCSSWYHTSLTVGSIIPGGDCVRTGSNTLCNVYEHRF